MRRTFAFILPLAILALVSLTPSIEPLAIGSPIPKGDTKMKDVSGKDISLKEAFKKKGLLVMFVCNTCPVVRAYRSRTLAICSEALSKEIGVTVLNSNAGSRDDGDSYDDMKNYASQQGYKWPYLLDTEAAMANAFGASRTPECFLFNSDGKLVYHGAIDDNQNSPDEVTRKHLGIAINEMLSGKDVSVKTTRSVGCSIKRTNE